MCTFDFYNPAIIWRKLCVVCTTFLLLAGKSMCTYVFFGFFFSSYYNCYLYLSIALHPNCAIWSLCKISKSAILNYWVIASSNLKKVICTTLWLSCCCQENEQVYTTLFSFQRRCKEVTSSLFFLFIKFLSIKPS